MAKIRTHYDNLKVSKSASPEEIRRAYKVLCQKYHPDKNTDDADATRKLTIINVAYSTLMDPVSRRRHDDWIASRKLAELDADNECNEPVSGPFSDSEEVLAEIRKYQERKNAFDWTASASVNSESTYKSTENQARKQNAGKERAAYKEADKEEAGKEEAGKEKPEQGKTENHTADHSTQETPSESEDNSTAFDSYTIERINIRALEEVRSMTGDQSIPDSLKNRSNPHPPSSSPERQRLKPVYVWLLLVLVLLCVLTFDVGKYSEVPAILDQQEKPENKENTIEWLENLQSDIDDYKPEPPKDQEWIDENIF